MITIGSGKAFSAGFDISPREEPRTTVQDWRDHAKALPRITATSVAQQPHDGGVAPGTARDLAPPPAFATTGCGCGELLFT
jgi:hypothetical protein